MVAACANVSDQKCSGDSTNTGDNYNYLYRRYNAWDVFGQIVNGAADLGKDVWKLVSNIGDFFAKYGLWIFLGLLVLFLLPIFISLIKR